MQGSGFADIDFSDFSNFVFKVNQVFIKKKHNPVENVFIDEEKLDGIEIEGFLNYLKSTVFIKNVGI